MTDDELRAYVHKSRVDQGLPRVIEDEDALDSFSAMVASALTRANGAGDAAQPRDTEIRKAS
jgi:hypothetical protein